SFPGAFFMPEFGIIFIYFGIIVIAFGEGVLYNLILMIEPRYEQKNQEQ
ncbi:MAG: hypothetical protein QG657_3843, partial [Acidobacteriota bacterium]|nr:hypothetical protein [Acidobacteriota bacterium]